jgi:hypothetical protein
MAIDVVSTVMTCAIAIVFSSIMSTSLMIMANRQDTF